MDATDGKTRLEGEARELFIIDRLYNWRVNEVVVPAWGLSVAFLAIFQSVCRLLSWMAPRSRVGCMATATLEASLAQRERSGSWLYPSRRLTWHHRQVLRFHALYLAAALATCGVGLLLLGPFYILAFTRARRELSRSGWPLLPIVGRWQPPPP